MTGTPVTEAEVFSTSFDVEDFATFVDRLSADDEFAMPAEVVHGLREVLSLSALETAGSVVLRPASETSAAIRCRFERGDPDTIELWVYGDAALAGPFGRAYQNTIADEQPPLSPPSMSAAERDQQWRMQVAQNQRDSAPVLEELRAAGLQTVEGRPLESLGQVSADQCPEAVPILLRWLPRMRNVRVKLTIARALSTSDDPHVRSVLFDEYQRVPRSDRHARESFAFALVNRVSEAEAEEIIAHARDRLDPGRAAFILALGGMAGQRERAIGVLLDALSDPDVAYVAIESLGQLGAVEALSAIRPFAETPDQSKRSVAKRAIARLERRANQRPAW